MDVLKRFLELARHEWDVYGDLFLDREVVIYQNVSYIVMKCDADMFHHLEELIK